MKFQENKSIDARPRKISSASGVLDPSASCKISGGNIFNAALLFLVAPMSTRLAGF